MGVSRRGLSRRELMGAGALGVGVLACVSSFAFAKAGASKGDAGCGYDGPGVYLYPGWGKPRPYLVRPAAGRAQAVEFRDPASQALLWTQSLSFCGDFAGKLSSLQEVGSQPF